MNTIVNDDLLKTLEQVRAFLDGTQPVKFTLKTKAERYGCVRRTLIRFGYHSLSKPDKGLLLNPQFLSLMEQQGRSIPRYVRNRSRAIGV